MGWLKDKIKGDIYENHNFLIREDHLFFYIKLKILEYLKFLKNIKYSYAHELKLTKLLRDKYKGLNAFVFANGPSLNILNMEKIKNYQENYNYKIICVSSYILSEKSKIIKPDFYLLSDPAFFQFQDNIGDEKKEEIKRVISRLNKLEIETFIPIQYKNMCNLKKVFYFNDCEYRFNKNIIDITKPRSYISMTAYKAIAMALYLCFDKIFICGFDNDYFKSLLVNKTNEMFYQNEHFFKQSDSSIIKINKEEAKNISELLYSHSFLFSDLYRFPKNKIINLNPNSLIDAFDKNHDLDVYYMNRL